MIVEAQGIPLAAVLTAANCNDIVQLEPLLAAIPPVRGKRGRPRFKPASVQGDRGYDSEPHRRRLRERGIRPILARRGTPHASGLGKTRYVVERSLSWFHQLGRLRVRTDRRADIHEAFMNLGLALICFKKLVASFC